MTRVGPLGRVEVLQGGAAFLDNRARTVRDRRPRSWFASLRKQAAENAPDQRWLPSPRRPPEATRGEKGGGIERTRFENDRHGVHDSGDRRPYLLRELDLVRLGVARDCR